MKSHDVTASVPVIEVADDTYARGIRRPNSKACTRNSLKRNDLRAELVVDLAVRPLAKQIQVNVAKRLWKTISVFDVCCMTIVCSNPKSVASFSRRHGCYEQPVGVHLPHVCNVVAISIDEINLLGLGLKSSHDT